MREPRKSLARVALVVVIGSLAACAGPAADPAQPPSKDSTSQISVDEPIAAAEPEQTAARETCDLFRQMIVGIDTLSTGDQQDLVDRMTDAVQASGDAELMYAVFDFATGYLKSNPKQFAYGMRELSVMCKVPYQ